MEIILGIIVFITMAKIASTDGQSPWLWGIVAFVLCGASLLIPLPFVRIGIAAAVSFLAMFIYKVVAKN